MGDERQTADGNYLADLSLEQLQAHALITLDLEGTVVGWFAGAEKILGYAAEEIIGQNISVIFTPEDIEKGVPKLELEVAQASGESEDDRWQLRKDGGKIWASGAAAPLRDPNGQLVGYVKVLRNRTDNKSHLGTLERSLKHLEEANARRSSFIPMLAHELRNPLASLSNAAAAIEMIRSESEDTKAALGIIRRQIGFMNQMIADVLDQARTATGKVELHKQRIAFQDLVSEAVETCRPTIDRQTHDLQLLMPEVPVYVLADRVRMVQVFMNLIENAVKYTPHGGAIWVKATVDGEDVVVKVQDTGIGIAPEIMPHIFDLFTQAKPTSGSQGGLGIGLSVVKDIVALHEGTVQVLSDGLGKGSQFVVRFPAAEPRSSTPVPEEKQ